MKTAQILRRCALILVIGGVRVLSTWIAAGAAEPTTRQAVREFYVDPDFKGAGQDGSAGTPWHSVNAPGVWEAINAELAKNPVTVYFSVREANADTSQTIAEYVQCQRIVIIDVAHLHRKPNYWVDRLA